MLCSACCKFGFRGSPSSRSAAASSCFSKSTSRSAASCTLRNVPPRSCSVASSCASEVALGLGSGFGLGLGLGLVTLTLTLALTLTLTLALTLPLPLPLPLTLTLP